MLRDVKLTERVGDLEITLASHHRSCLMNSEGNINSLQNQLGAYKTYMAVTLAKVDDDMKALGMENSKLRQAIKALEDQFQMALLQMGFEFYMTDEIPEVPAIPAIPPRLDIRQLAKPKRR